MHKLLEHLENWKASENKIFTAEMYYTSITNELGFSNKARYIEIDGNGLLARATIWESGNLVVEVIDIESESTVISTSFDTQELWQLDDKLNWWLSEITTYTR